MSNKNNCSRQNKMFSASTKINDLLYKIELKPKQNSEIKQYFL